MGRGGGRWRKEREEEWREREILLVDAIKIRYICSLLKTLKLVHAKLDLFQITKFNTHN